MHDYFCFFVFFGCVSFWISMAHNFKCTVLFMMAITVRDNTDFMPVPCCFTIYIFQDLTLSSLNVTHQKAVRPPCCLLRTDMIPAACLSLENKDGRLSHAQFCGSGDRYKHHFCYELQSNMVTPPPLHTPLSRNVGCTQLIHLFTSKGISSAVWTVW